MSTYTLDTGTSRANPTPAPMKRLTIPAIRNRKGKDPVVMLTAYTTRMAQLLDPHCDVLLVGDSLGQVIYGLPSTLPVTLDMMIAHGAAVVRGSWHSVVIVDMPFGSYEASPERAFESAARVLAETGAAGVKLEGGTAMAPVVEFLTRRGIPVMGHIGLTPQAVNALGGYGARGRSNAEHASILDDARAIADAGAFGIVAEGVVEGLANEITAAVPVPVIGIGASAQCDGQVLVTEDMLGLFERTPRFVKRYDDLAGRISAAVATYAAEVRSRDFPGAEQVYPARD
ncbi:3-methyl-2-oxobutanoate hydroxymethyltransferase [Sphingomonas naasensis]|uniref:3-methyl-2-oxobutanoate hydroxymethyltransferase n=1 Tax=Sphingomonas naasensis TaxID=1344951 RepID=A0A4S1W8H3_9SPHN|nr:3-methyl-2-oxobutanoate hydroxymethyltransferase [Sphingomonas naasensis]NIJ19452.1 3-methyl-2-oxobutanoate hydroxymethyltransferase [Sphingomonas naasensis]TGX39191.1 3-methyl-2-oxobutanoate hydroxymethyltransferase [Sphingomonas naasensis]